MHSWEPRAWATSAGISPIPNRRSRGSTAASSCAGRSASSKRSVIQVANVDATVVAQKPKLAPYFAAMRENLAADLRVDPGQVNLKGTTTEGMGFAGREEGIAAHAVALLCRVTNTEV